MIDDNWETTEWVPQAQGPKKPTQRFFIDASGNIKETGARWVIDDADGVLSTIETFGEQESKELRPQTCACGYQYIQQVVVYKDSLDITFFCTSQYPSVWCLFCHSFYIAEKPEAIDDKRWEEQYLHQAEKAAALFRYARGELGVTLHSDGCTYTTSTGLEVRLDSMGHIAYNAPREPLEVQPIVLDPPL